MTVAKFTEVLDGFEFGAFGAMPTNQAFISLERGTVHFVSSELELEEDDDSDDSYDDDDNTMVMNLKNVLDCIGCQACSKVCPKKCMSHAPQGLAA